MADPFKFLSGVGQAHLLNCISTLFNGDEDLIMFFFSHKEPVLRMPARCLLEEASKLSIKDQLLIRVALEFWNRRGYARLADMLADWDYDYWVRFICAVAKLLEIEQELLDAIKETPKPKKR